jgi:hypothetical protein
VKHLVTILIACAVSLGSIALAAPTGVVDMGSFYYGSKPLGYGAVYRFQDKGPDVTINCYVAAINGTNDALEMQCFQIRMKP